MMKYTRRDKYKQSYSEEHEHCNIDDVVQFMVLEAFHTVSQFLGEIANTNSHICQKDKHDRDTQQSEKYQK